jgi:hypothetical protein
VGGGDLRGVGDERHGGVGVVHGDGDAGALWRRRRCWCGGEVEGWSWRVGGGEAEAGVGVHLSRSCPVLLWWWEVLVVVESLLGGGGASCLCCARTSSLGQPHSA